MCSYLCSQGNGLFQRAFLRLLLISHINLPLARNAAYNTRLSHSLGFYFLKNLRGYRLFVHIAAALGGFMFTKRANRGAMRKSWG